ncbi:MAG: T9SS type A sorting domain-containing protein [Bacteroidia bacterium]
MKNYNLKIWQFDNLKMKKIAIIYNLAFIIYNSIGYAQTDTLWQSYGSGLPLNWGIRYLHAVDANTVWAIGAYGPSTTASNRFTKTGNGASYTAGTFLVDTNTFNATSICALDSNTAFISIYDKAADGTSGQILKTTNSGALWTNIASNSMFLGTNNFPDFVYFWKDSTGIAVGDPNGHTNTNTTIQEFEIWRTTDSAHTWTRVKDSLLPPPLTNEYGLSNSYAVYAQKVWFGTTKGRVYTSIDSGKWVAYSTGLLGGANGLAFRDSLHGIAWGFETTTTQKITVMNTSNGGRNWTPSPTNLAIGTTDFCLIPGTYGYVSVGLNGETVGAYVTSVSYNEGTSWTVLESNLLNIENISVVQMIDTLHGWAGTKNTNNTTGMNKYIGHNIAGINELGMMKDELRIYPNPASTIINLTISRFDNSKTNSIEIYNTLGECVHSQIIGYPLGQSSNSQIDVSKLAEGVYQFIIHPAIGGAEKLLIVR